MLETAAIFQDGMVLQREKKVCVWGKGEPFRTIRVSVQGQVAETTADAGGDWQCYLRPLIASRQERMVIEDDNMVLNFEDVAVGEVWIGAGQSNMEFYMRYERHIAKERETCEDSDIRFFDVPKVSYDGQLTQFDYHRMNIWRKATPEDLDYFSAPGYYFAKMLKEQLNIPVAVIGCNWGGTVAEAWMRVESVAEVSPDWLADFHNNFRAVDMNVYWEKQKQVAWNDHGNPFMNAFNEKVMPNIVTLEELDTLFTEESSEIWEGMDEWKPEAFPGALYEHMVKTIAPFSVKGVLWYQGESDDTDSSRKRYAAILTTLIDDWRMLWKADTLPFLVVQLPGFENWLGLQNYGYEIIRQQQQLVTDTIKDTWLCSISDAGEQLDIHPKNKKIVGERLALCALGHVYGMDILCDPPKAVKVVRDGDKIICSFANAGNGLYIEENQVLPLKIIAVGEDVKYKIEAKGSQLIVTLANNVQNPVCLEFAQEKWFRVNLYNSAGIPAVPFMYKV